jgi:type IV pilus assembly protein PilF
MIRLACALVCVSLLGGCVTESTGGNQAAPKSVQLQAHLDLARGYLEKQDWNRAIEPLKRAVEVDPKSAEAYTLMGVMYQGQREPERAEEAYRRALRNDPRYAMALNNYGTFLYGRGRFEDALPLFRKLADDPEYRARAQAYQSLGLTELKVGNRERARVAFERAVSFETVLPRSRLELAELAYDDGDLDAANLHFDVFRERARQTPRSLCLGLHLAERGGDSDQKASYQIALRNLYPDSPEAKRCLAEG